MNATPAHMNLLRQGMPVRTHDVVYAHTLMDACRAEGLDVDAHRELDGSFTLQVV